MIWTMPSRSASTRKAACSASHLEAVAHVTYDSVDEDAWLSMLDDRNTAQHVYDVNLAARLVNAIPNRFWSTMHPTPEALCSADPVAAAQRAAQADERCNPHPLQQRKPPRYARTTSATGWSRSSVPMQLYCCGAMNYLSK